MEEMKEGNLYVGVAIAATSLDNVKISSIERTHGGGSKSDKDTTIQSASGFLSLD